MNTGPSDRGDAALLIVIMGVTASGKSTVASALAQATGWPVLEGDDFHPPENIARMKAGIALDNADRSGWIDAIGSAVRAAPQSAPVILACSALNEEVRSRLAKAAGRGCFWVLLDVPKSQLAARLQRRKNHFMPASLLGSQLDALEPPRHALRIDGTQSVAQICRQISDALGR